MEKTILTKICGAGYFGESPHRKSKYLTSTLTWFILVCLFLTLTSTLTYAAIIGKITAVEGNVDIMKPGQERVVPGRLLEPVSEGDIVRTKSSGKAEITFDDESIIRLAPNTRLQITEYLMEGSKRKSGVMNLFRGKIRAVVSKSRRFIGIAFGEGERFEVRTPTAVAGVKGTDFFVTYALGITGVAVLEGRIDTFNPAIPGQVVLVTAGNATTIAENQPPQTPRPVSDVEKIRHTRDTDPAEKPKDKDDEDETMVAAATAEGVFGYEAPEDETLLTGVAGAADAEPDALPVTETHPELFAPIITIVSSPASITNSKVATFVVTTSEPVTFTYTMDTWGATSPTTTSDTLTITGLSEGSHTILITAANSVGNKSTTSYTWTTDYTAPSALSLTGTPASITNINSATIGATATDATAVTYSYTLDGASSTGTLTGLSEGLHTFVVTATDAAGNSSAPTSYSWTTDYTPAAITFTAPPAAATNINTADFSFTSSETAAYSYTFDGSPTGATSFTVTADGSHIFTVVATDAAGNTSTTSYSWLTDTVLPTASIAPVSASLYKGGPNIEVSIDLSSTEPSTTYEYSLDGGSTWTFTGSSLILPPRFEGSYTLAVRATDAATNTSATTSLPFILSSYSLTGSVSDTSAFMTGITSGEVVGVSNENWGSYQIGMIGEASQNPSSSPTFRLNIGGTSTDNLPSNGGGYWFETIDVTATGTVLDGVLSGTSTLKYLSSDRLGTGIGIFTGTYAVNSEWYDWLATDTGTYTETPLAWSGKIGIDQNSSGLYSLDNWSYWLDIEGNSTGLMGVAYDPNIDPWSQTSAVAYLGTYDVLGGIGVGPPYLWTPEIYSYNINNSTNTTFDGGTYKGFIGGVWKADATIDANVYAIYIDPLGNAGILKGGMTGAYYPSLNMFEADGTWTPTALATGLNPATATPVVVSTDYGLNSISITSLSNFNGSGSITVAGNEMLAYTDWRYYYTTAPDWGVYKSIIGGDYIGPAPDPTCATAGSCDTWSLSTFVDLSSQDTIYGTQTDGIQWSNGILAGTTYGYGADIIATPMTWISVGETIGTFDANTFAWQAVQTGAWLETAKFLTMAGKIGSTPDTAALAALNIPFAEVGRTNLTGTNGIDMNATMNNVIFFAYNSGEAPKIWATNEVTGNYTCSACSLAPITLSGAEGLSATMAIQQWDTTNNKWTATVNGGGTYTGTGTMIDTNVQMTGAAAGTNTGIGPGNFSGTAAGTAQ